MTATAITPRPADPRAVRDGITGTIAALRQRPRAAAAATVLLGIVVMAVAAPVLAPADPAAQDLAASYAGPSAEHWLGADRLGRDTASRLIFGARFSLLAAVQAVGLAVLLGAPAGIVAGMAGGRTDRVLTVLADAVLSIPAIVLALAIVGVLGPNLTNAMIAIGVVYAPRLFRVVRGAALGIASEDFIEAARLAGVGPLTIAWTHVAPGVLPPLAVQASLAMGFAVLAEAGLSFLGLGVQPPDASWGVMVGQATTELADSPVLVLAPGLAMVITILSFNVLGDALAGAGHRGGRHDGR